MTTIGSSAPPLRIPRLLLAVLLLALLGGSGCGDSSNGCAYPATAGDAFVVGEPIPAFSWPTADDVANGAAPLDLVDVACDSDPTWVWADVDFLVVMSFDAFDPESLQQVGSIIDVADDFVAEGADILWVMETDAAGQPATATDCANLIEAQTGAIGLCVGDAETQPDAGAFQAAPFAIGRGFTALVRRSDMRIEFVTTHGTPAGNQNLTGSEILDALRML